MSSVNIQLIYDEYKLFSKEFTGDVIKAPFVIHQGRKIPNISEIFESLKKEFKYPNIRVQYSLPPPKLGGFRLGEFNYTCSNDLVICLINNIPAPLGIHTLLHEFKHALQYREGKLGFRKYKFSELWDCEMEAEEFADEYYKRFFSFLPKTIELILDKELFRSVYENSNMIDELED